MTASTSSAGHVARSHQTGVTRLVHHNFVRPGVNPTPDAKSIGRLGGRMAAMPHFLPAAKGESSARAGNHFIHPEKGHDMTEQKRDDQGQFTASADWFSALVAGNPPAADPNPDPDPGSDWLTAVLRGATEPPADTPAEPPPAATTTPTTPKGQRR